MITNHACCFTENSKADYEVLKFSKNLWILLRWQIPSRCVQQIDEQGIWSQ